MTSRFSKNGQNVNRVLSHPPHALQNFWRRQVDTTNPEQESKYPASPGDFCYFEKWKKNPELSQSYFQLLQGHHSLVGSADSLHHDEVRLFWKNSGSIVQVSSKECFLRENNNKSPWETNIVSVNIFGEIPRKYFETDSCEKFCCKEPFLFPQICCSKAESGVQQTRTVGGDFRRWLHRWSFLCYCLPSSWYNCVQTEPRQKRLFHGCCQKPGMGWWVLMASAVMWQRSEKKKVERLGGKTVSSQPFHLFKQPKTKKKQKKPAKRCFLLCRNVEGTVPEDYHDRYLDGAAVVHLRLCQGASLSLQLFSEINIFIALENKKSDVKWEWVLAAWENPNQVFTPLGTKR